MIVCHKRTIDHPSLFAPQVRVQLDGLLCSPRSRRHYQESLQTSYKAQSCRVIRSTKSFQSVLSSKIPQTIACVYMTGPTYVGKVGGKLGSLLMGMPRGHVTVFFCFGVLASATTSAIVKKKSGPSPFFHLPPAFRLDYFSPERNRSPLFYFHQLDYDQPISKPLARQIANKVVSRNQTPRTTNIHFEQGQPEIWYLRD